MLHNTCTYKKKFDKERNHCLCEFKTLKYCNYKLNYSPVIIFFVNKSAK